MRWRRWENENNGDGDDGDIYMRTRTIEMGTMETMGEQEQWRWRRWENRNNGDGDDVDIRTIEMLLLLLLYASHGDDGRTRTMEMGTMGIFI